MGQAKIRGSFEERQSKAVVAKQKRIADWEQEKISRQAAMSPSERQKQREARRFISMALGLSAGYSIQHNACLPTF